MTLPGIGRIYLKGYHSSPWERPDNGVLILSLFTFILSCSIWIIRPIPISYLATMMMFSTIILVQISRKDIFFYTRRLSVEFTLLLIIILLAALSITNSNAPFRCFRVIYPATVPLLLFVFFVAVNSVSRERLLWIPRFVVGSAFFICTAPIFAAFVIPPVKSFIMTTYRVEGFFENPIQHTIVLGTMFPILVGEFALSRKKMLSIFLGFLVLLYVYTMFRAGSKMAMGTSILISTIMFIVIKLRSQSIAKTMLMFIALAGIVLFFMQFGLPIAEKIAPMIAEKIKSVLQSKGNYHSIQSRKILWAEAINQGNRHWLVGSGAGENLYGVAHAHNLVLDYYKGTGIFGAVAIVMLCGTIALRTVNKGVQVLRGIGDDNDRRVFACYTGAIVYVFCNQMSDCFGPSTIGFLWIVYLSGVICDKHPILIRRY